MESWKGAKFTYQRSVKHWPSQKEDVAAQSWLHGQKRSGDASEVITNRIQLSNHQPQVRDRKLPRWTSAVVQCNPWHQLDYMNTMKKYRRDGLNVLVVAQTTKYWSPKWSSTPQSAELGLSSPTDRLDPMRTAGLARVMSQRFNAWTNNSRDTREEMWQPMARTFEDFLSCTKARCGPRKRWRRKTHEFLLLSSETATI